MTYWGANKSKFIRNLKIKNIKAKYLVILLILEGYTFSINELSKISNLSPREVKNCLKFLIDNKIIFRRDGCIPSYTNDINDTIYQYGLID